MSSASPAGGSESAAEGGGSRGAAAAGRPVKEKKEKKDKATRMRERELAAAQQSSHSPAQPQQQQESARAVIPIDDGGLREPDGAYGDLLLVQSSYEDSRVWLEVPQCDEAAVGQLLWLRARLSTVRSKGKFAFVVLRKGFSSVQALLSEGQHGWTREAVKWAARVPLESIVDVFGQLVQAEQPTHTSQSRVEIQLRKMFVVSLASPLLPFQLSDAARPLPDRAAAAAASPTAAAAEATAPAEDGKADRKEGSGEAGGGGLVVEADGVITVGQDLRLDHRWIDLRTAANHAIFRIQSRVCQYFRHFFVERDFIEIHTPKLTPGVSEGGAAVFRLKYFERDACLAQSPQLYKQMAICSDLSRVFEIGPVFRAEYSNTHRHLCEFTGLDFEMEVRQHYHEVLAVLSDALVFVFDQLNAHCQPELQAVQQQFPFTPLRYRKETLILPFSNAVKMLQDAGEDIGPEDDFSTPQEKRLGRLVSDKWGVDFYIVDQYPLSARPFYTMPSASNPRFTNSYDVFVRGEEITSGAQRVHDVELLQRRARECGIPDAGIASYVDSFKFGAWPHGGAGIGLERVVMLFLGLDNIRKSSLFPRTPNRYTP